LVPDTVKLSTKKKIILMGIGWVAGLTFNRLLMRVDNSAGKGMSDMDKLAA